jgi:two-component system sensor histidine kinase RegB
LGAPYNSSKGRAGGGLGLFLSVNVARTLGGRLSARNLPAGGAAVTITLPLAAIAIDEPLDDPLDGRDDDRRHDGRDRGQEHHDER